MEAETTQRDTRTAEYEEELSGAKEDMERKRQLLDAIGRMQPRIVLHRAVFPHIKEEEEEKVISHFKEEAAHQSPFTIKEENVGNFPLTDILLKVKDEDQSEESRGADPPSSSSCQQHTTKGDGDKWRGSQVDGLFAPLSQSDDMSLRTPHDGADKTCRADRQRWKCTHCGSRFVYESSLKRHMKIHTGEEKPFSCSVCGRRYSAKGYLQTHARTHTGEKPFSCSMCEQRFMWRCHLNRHIRTHFVEKPFCCLVCGKRFSQEGNFIIHISFHTGIKPFACSVCDQRFSQRGDLTLHMRIHTQVRKCFPAQFVVKNPVKK
ncbi:uncharacterized protein LOC144009834 isoform X2 [Festucalex cinctus]